MGNKSGQFYLVAAVILAGVIIGISATSNYAKKEESPGISELREEIQIESAKTLDYGTKNGFSQAQMKSLMQNFTNYYVSYEGSNNKDIYFLFGTKSNITVSGNQKESKQVTLTSGASQVVITEQAGNFIGSFDPSENEVVIHIDDNPYTFNLSSAENFYFVITQNVGGGEYVVTGWWGNVNYGKDRAYNKNLNGFYFNKILKLVEFKS